VRDRRTRMPQTVPGRTVICRNCGNAALVPALSRSIVMCPCGSPLVPMNDILLRFLAEGGEWRGFRPHTGLMRWQLS
jgi:ribosomal protein S27E